MRINLPAKQSANPLASLAESLNELKDRLTDELADLELQKYDASSADGPPLSDIANRIQYRLTSVYDYSIFEALSRVIMKLVPQQAALENLMNLLAQQSGIEKCFLVGTPFRPKDHPSLTPAWCTTV